MKNFRVLGKVFAVLVLNGVIITLKPKSSASNHNNFAALTKNKKEAIQRATLSTGSIEDLTK
ncbi:hypothetical protein HXY33_05550 [Candidatus Bathyarchaeota archaeon]|nr:hypothetical protein [Candidatus Bathyarchaeota archaeon]